MSSTLRFPRPRNIPNVGQAEIDQIITILPATVGPLLLGGEQAYVSVNPWKLVGEGTETPYSCIVLEFASSVAAATIGDGLTDMIGLYGQIDLATNPTTAAQRKRTLLAVLGINLGQVMPQIPIRTQAAPANDLIGFSQVVSNIGNYDRLSIGGVLADVALPEGMNLTVTARPIRRKDYLG